AAEVHLVDAFAAERIVICAQGDATWSRSAGSFIDDGELLEAVIVHRAEIRRPPAEVRITARAARRIGDLVHLDHGRNLFGWIEGELGAADEGGLDLLDTDIDGRSRGDRLIELQVVGVPVDELLLEGADIAVPVFEAQAADAGG